MGDQPYMRPPRKFAWMPVFLGSSILFVLLVLGAVITLVDWRRVASHRELARSGYIRGASGKPSVTAFPARIAKPSPAACHRTVPAHAIGNPGNWFPVEAYPTYARMAGQEGRVVVCLDIATDGRVTGCTVLASSGYATLDTTTCSLAVANARYAPPGRATAVTLPIRWQLED